MCMSLVLGHGHMACMPQMSTARTTTPCLHILRCCLSLASRPRHCSLLLCSAARRGRGSGGGALPAAVHRGSAKQLASRHAQLLDSIARSGSNLTSPSHDQLCYLLNCAQLPPSALVRTAQLLKQLAKAAPGGSGKQRQALAVSLHDAVLASTQMRSSATLRDWSVLLSCMVAADKPSGWAPAAMQRLLSAALDWCAAKGRVAWTSGVDSSAVCLIVWNCGRASKAAGGFPSSSGSTARWQPLVDGLRAAAASGVLRGAEPQHLTMLLSGLHMLGIPATDQVMPVWEAAVPPIRRAIGNGSLNAGAVAYSLLAATMVGPNSVCITLVMALGGDSRSIARFRRVLRADKSAARCRTILTALVNMKQRMQLRQWRRMWRLTAGSGGQPVATRRRGASHRILQQP